MKYANELMERYPMLKDVKEDIIRAVRTIIDSYNKGEKILIAGNGGSAADAEHISGELLKGFITKRTPEAAELSSLSAFANDVSPKFVYAQLVYALGKVGDVLICLSTSGDSENVVLAAKLARSLGIATVALTGMSGGKLAEICDVTVKVPERETFKVQELHLPIYHVIYAEVENILFS